MKNNRMAKTLRENLKAKIYSKKRAIISLKVGAPMIPISQSDGKPNRSCFTFTRNNASSPKEQREALLSHLENYLWIDSLYAAAELHIWDLPSRIRTLQRQGYKVFKCDTRDSVPRYGFIRKIDPNSFEHKDVVRPREESNRLIGIVSKLGFEVDISEMTDVDWLDLYCFIRRMHRLSNS